VDALLHLGAKVATCGRNHDKTIPLAIGICFQTPAYDGGGCQQ
jgi:hypothetical protein